MTVGIGACDSPGQSVAIGLASGLLAAGVAMIAGLGTFDVILLAGALALGIELLAHAVSMVQSTGASTGESRYPIG